MMESKALLFIHAAYEDNKFYKSEREFIKQKFSSTNIEKIIEEYKELEPGVKIAIITDLIYDMVANKNDFAQLRKELLQLFTLDGDMSRFEEELLKSIEKMQIGLTKGLVS